MLILREGDYVPDGRGGFRKAEGEEELLERILWKLSVRRGSFPFLPELGSRLHLLGRIQARERQALAGQYVMEALADEDVVVAGVELEGEEMTLRLERRGESLTAVLKVGGMI